MQNMADIGSFSPRPMLDEGALASIRVSPHQSEYRPPELVTVGSAPNLAVLAAVDAGPAIPRMSPSSSAENLSGGSRDVISAFVDVHSRIRNIFWFLDLRARKLVFFD